MVLEDQLAMQHGEQQAMTQQRGSGMMRWTRWSVPAVLAVSLALSGCGTGITIGAVTFGNQRTPPTIVTVANTDPAPFASHSQNWSGYYMQEWGMTTVQGSWQVPRVTGPRESDSSTWVGIGGVRNNSLIQAGTDQLIQKGKTYYFAWYELLPAPPQTFKNLNVLPGDNVTFSITYQGGDTWRIDATDHDARQQASKTVHYHSCQCSAEWIEEAPTVRQQQAQLANFGSVTFTNIGATIQHETVIPSRMCPFPLRQKPYCSVPIRMVDRDDVTLVEPQRLYPGTFSLVYVYDPS